MDGIRTWLRERPGDGTPVVFWHGNPTDSDDWIPFMERLDRRSVAADMPGFGRSEAPDPARFPYTVDAYGRWAEALIRSLGFDRYSLVIHDWGSIGLLPALRNPEQVERIVAFNSVPLGLGYEWHRTARIWRRRGAGELANAISRGRLIDLSLREARPGFKAMPAHIADRVHRNMGRRETRDAILRLYRSAPAEKLDELGRDLPALEAPTLLLWAKDDPYIGPEIGPRWAERAPNAILEEVDRAGHWPWVDRPELINRAIRFLEAGGA